MRGGLALALALALVMFRSAIRRAK
eukprot:COSAG01_NODE_7550_length_3156_cov_2.407589_1_plen_24_part_10